MSTLEPAQPRTPEQHDAVRRRSLTLALCGLFCGIFGLIMLLGRPVSVERPPVLFAASIAFCAIMIGVGILFYIKGTTGVRAAMIASVLAVLTGIAGTLVYSGQTVSWRQQVESGELANAEAIAKSALAYARNNQGNYPASLAALLRNGLIALNNTRSPFGGVQTPRDVFRLNVELQTLQRFQHLDRHFPGYFTPIVQVLGATLAQEIDTYSDYQYFGSGLTLPASQSADAKLPEEIIIVTSRNAIMRRQLTVAFADGRAIYLDQEEAEFALLTSNEARVAMGFSAIRPPQAIERAQKLKQTPSAPPPPRN